MNASPDAIAAINQFPVKQVAGETVFVRDVAHVHDGYQIQTNVGDRRWPARRLDDRFARPAAFRPWR